MADVYSCDWLYAISRTRSNSVLVAQYGLMQRRAAGPVASGSLKQSSRSLKLPVRCMAQPGTAAPPAAAPAQSGTDGAARFVRKHLLDVPPYTPIEPFEVLSARYGRTPQQIVKLDANENPYGPPPEVRKALAEMPWPHIYPDPETRQLRKALAELSGVPEEYLLVCGGGGSGGSARTRRSGGCAYMHYPQPLQARGICCCSTLATAHMHAQPPPASRRRPRKASF